MPNGIPISEAVSLAMHSVAFIASRSEPSSVHEISQRLGVSEFHLSKVLQRLSKCGLVRSNRGPRGGFTLTGKSDSLTLMDVYEAIEGRLKGHTCLMNKKTCDSKECILGDTLTAMRDIFRKHMNDTRISDIAGRYRQETQ
jgi:Rrf2 family protein